MFWTAFVWGAGVSLGASIGLMVFVFMYAACRRIVESKSYSQAEAFSQHIMAAWDRRNELAMEANTYLAVIADAHLDCDIEDDDSDESWRG